MKKITKFLLFMTLLVGLLIIGTQAVSAESNVFYDSTNKVVTYTSSDIDIAQSGRFFLAAYADGGLMGLESKNINSGYDYVSEKLLVDKKPDVVKAFVFDENLTPISSLIDISSTDIKDVEKNTSMTFSHISYPYYNETTGVLEFYAGDLDVQTTKVSLNTKNLTIYYNDSVLSGTAINTVGGLSTLLEEKADIVTFDGLLNEKYTKIYITDYIYKQVQSVDIANQRINFTSGYLLLDTQQRNDANFVYNLYDESGNSISLTDIRKNDVLNILSTMDNWGYIDYYTSPYLDVCVTNKKVTGMITELRDGKYVIEEQLYDVEDGISVSVGSKGVFYISIDNTICGAELYPTDRNYAFIIDYISISNFGLNSYEITLYTEEGVTKTYEIAPKLSVYDEKTGYATYSQDDGTMDTFFKTTVFPKICAEATWDEAKTKLGDRIVVFSINPDDEIYSLEFPRTSEMSYVTNGRYYSDSNAFAGKEIGVDTRLFLAPVTEVDIGCYNVQKDDMDLIDFSLLTNGKTYDAFTFMYGDYLSAAVIGEKAVYTKTICGDVESYDETTGKVEYYEEDELTAELYINTESLCVYYNNVLLDETDLTNLGGLKKLLEDDADVIRFANETEQGFEKIFVTEYIYAKALASNSKNMTIESTIGTICLDGNERSNDEFEYYIYDSNRNRLTISEISENDILNIVVPMYDRQKGKLNEVSHVVIYVSTESFNGTVDEKISDNEYVINTDEYKIENNVKLEIGNQYILYTTIDGKICFAEQDSSSCANYAFIAGYEGVQSFVNTTHRLQMYRENGKVSIYSVAPTLRVYDEEYLDNSWQYARRIYKRSDGTLNTFFEIISALVADEATEAVAKAKLCDRLVTFITNSNNEIVELRFAGKNVDDFKVESIVDGQHDKDSQTFAHRAFDNKSTLFVTPVTEIEPNRYNVDLDNFEVLDFSVLDETETYDAHLYSAGIDSKIDAGIIGYKIPLIRKYSHLAVVTAVGTTIDAEWNAVRCYDIIQSSKELFLKVDYDASDKVESMDIGDVFRYALNNEGEIIETHIIYDSSSKTFDAGDFSFENYDDNGIAFVYGKVTKISNDKMTVASADNGNDLLLRLNDTEENTYVLVNRDNPMRKQDFTIIDGPNYLFQSTNTNTYNVIAMVGENLRYEDCIEIRVEPY